MKHHVTRSENLSYFTELNQITNHLRRNRIYIRTNLICIQTISYLKDNRENILFFKNKLSSSDK